MLQRSRNAANNNTSSKNRSKDGGDVLATAAAATGRATPNAAKRKRLAGRPKSKPHEVFCVTVLFAAFLFYVVHLLHSASNMTGGGSSSQKPGGALSLDFQGTSRTGGKKPRIAIVSNAVAFPFNEETTAQWSLFKEYFANKDCYAQTHGYDLIIDSR